MNKEQVQKDCLTFMDQLRTQELTLYAEIKIPITVGAFISLHAASYNVYAPMERNPELDRDCIQIEGPYGLMTFSCKEHFNSIKRIELEKRMREDKILLENLKGET